MRLLGVDFETTGLDPEKDLITEIGASVWEFNEGKCRMVLMHSELIRLEPARDLTPEITALTGIETGDLVKHGVSEYMALTNLWRLTKTCDYMVAHNAEFEMKFLGRAISRNEVNPARFEFGALRGAKWIDTKIHLPYPASIGPRDLVSLCSYHGFYNPHPHRAMWDAWAMMKIFGLYADRVNEIEENARAPKVKLWSKGITFNTKELPKSLSYYWDTASKRWWTIVKETEVDDAIAKAREKGFQVERETMPLCQTVADFESLGTGAGA